MSEIKTLRRYYLMKSRAAAERQERALRDTWTGKQDAEPGTVLPEDFPSRADLAALGYKVAQDLDGADSDELVALGISRKQADKVFLALPALL